MRFYNIGVKEIWDMIYEYIDFVKTNVSIIHNSGGNI